MLKILIVDDDRDILKMLRYNFKKYFDVTIAASGREALRTIKIDFPDVFLVDYMMPEMDGKELVREIRKIGKPVPIIMLTAKTDTETIFAMAQIVDAYITKPFDFKDLFASVLMTMMEYKQKRIETLEYELSKYEQGKEGV